MDNRYVLVLVSLNPDGTDLSGNSFTKHGDVEAKNYKPNKDVRYGLYGTLGGKTENNKWLNLDPNSKWAVVKTVSNEDMIMLDQFQNFVKFRKGTVICYGDRDICTKCISVAYSDSEFQEGLCGNKFQSNLPAEHITLTGFESTAVVNGAGTHAINIGQKGIAKANGDYSAAIALGEKGKAVAVGDFSAAVGLNRYCTGMVGENGTLMLTYSDGVRDRVAIGYAGETIHPYVTYRVGDDGCFYVTLGV